jgi:uncharacterized protein YkwD
MESSENPDLVSELGLEDRLVESTNEYRARHGRGPLVPENRLSAAARRQAQRCKEAGKLDHQLGGSLGSRVKAEGYHFAVVGENLAKRFPPAENILKGWINSPGHRDNLLGRHHSQTGVGIVMAGRLAYACAIYAKPPRAGLTIDEEMLETSSLFIDQDSEATLETEGVAE